MLFEIDFTLASFFSFCSDRLKTNYYRPFTTVLILSAFVCWLNGGNIEGVIAQDAQSILQQMHQKQQERWKGVENYTVTMSVQDAMGMETTVYYVKDNIDGKVTFRQVPRPLFEREIQMKAGMPPPEVVAAEMADAYRLFGASGVPSYGLDFNEMAGFLDAGAAAYGQMSDGTAEAKDDLADMEEFVKRAQLVGTSMVQSTYAESGEPELTEAYHLLANNLEDLPMEQHEGGGEFTLERASLFVEKEKLVPLALTMHGHVENGGKTMPITISKFETDYKQVGSLYEPHNTVYQISGIVNAMSKKEQKEMEQAKAQLENMTDDQKAMMEQMMPGKMEQLKKMIEGEAYRSVVKVTNIAINEGPPSPYGLGSNGPEGVLTIAAETENESGMLVAELAVTSGPMNSQEFQVGLIGNMPFPMEQESVLVVNATGSVKMGDKQVAVIGGNGSIDVLIRTETRIAGTYNAQLQLEGNQGFSIQGNFDSGAPIGPGQAPRGSPIPADMFSSSD